MTARPWIVDRFFAYRKLLLLAVTIATVTALWGVTQLRFNDNLAAIFKADNAGYRELLAFFEDFGEDDRDCVLVLKTGKSFFQRQRMTAIRGLVHQLEELPEVGSVHSILDARVSAPGRLWKIQLPLIPREAAEPADFEQAEKNAHGHPLVAGQLLSDDGSTMLIIVRLSGRSVSTAEIRRAVGAVQQVVERYQDPDVQVSITGLPQLRADIYASIRRDQFLFTTLGACIALAIATLLFRRPAAVLVVCVPPVVGTVWTLGLLGFAGESINTFNSILPALVLVIGLTDSVHFMVDIRREQSGGRTPQEAAAVSLQHMFMPIALTALTTGVGFGSLVIAQIEVIQRFGAACAAGAVLNFLAVMSLVPLMASTRLGLYVTVDGAGAAMERRVQGLLGRLVNAILPRARTVAAVGCVAVAILLSFAIQLEPENLIRTGVPRGTDSYRSLQHCDRVFGGAMHAYVVVEWPDDQRLESSHVLEALADIHALLQEPDEFGEPLSVLNLLAALPHRRGRLDTAVKYLDVAPQEIVRRLVRTDLHRAVVRIQNPDLGARAMGPIYEGLDERLTRLKQQGRYSGFDFRLTGSSVVASRNVNQMIVDLCRSLGLASVVIFTVIAIAFRSLRFGLISVLPNAAPLVCAAAMLVAFGGSLEVAGVVTFSICLGIAVDDTIHFISRFQAERRQTSTSTEAIVTSIRKVGSALVVTTLTLLAGFSVGLFSQIPAMQLFSLLSCVALATALIADVTLLPALLMCFWGNARARSPEAE